MSDTSFFDFALPVVGGSLAGLAGINLAPWASLVNQRNRQNTLAAQAAQNYQFQLQKEAFDRQQAAQEADAQTALLQKYGITGPGVENLDPSIANTLLKQGIAESYQPDLTTGDFAANPAFAAFAQQLDPTSVQVREPFPAHVELTNPPVMEQISGDTPFGRLPEGGLAHVRTDLGDFREQLPQFMDQLTPGEVLYDTQGNAARVAQAAQPTRVPVPTQGPTGITVNEDARKLVAANLGILYDPTADPAKKAQAMVNLGIAQGDQKILAGVQAPTVATKPADLEGSGDQQTIAQTLFSPGGGSMWNDPAVKPFQKQLIALSNKYGSKIPWFALPPELMAIGETQLQDREMRKKLLEGLGPEVAKATDEFIDQTTKLNSLISVANELAIVGSRITTSDQGFLSRSGQWIKVLRDDLIQDDPDLEYFKALSTNMIQFARDMFGAKGPLSDQDIQRLLPGFPEGKDLRSAQMAKLGQLAARIQAAQSQSTEQLVKKAQVFEDLAQGKSIMTAVDRLLQEKLPHVDLSPYLKGRPLTSDEIAKQRMKQRRKEIPPIKR